MTIERAIQTAIEFENEVRDVYKAAAEEAVDPVGKRVFTVLANEEQGHVDYLQSRLEEWRKTGKVDPVALDTAVPSREVVAEAADNVSKSMSDVDHGTELKMLGKAHGGRAQDQQLLQKDGRRAVGGRTEALSAVRGDRGRPRGHRAGGDGFGNWKRSVVRYP